jgi:hypothetical protein
MNKLYLLTALKLIILLMAISPASAEDDDLLEEYMSECNAPAALYDPEIMAKTMADPNQFLLLLEELSVPATSMSMYECVANEAQLETVINTMTDPEKLATSMTTFMSPEMYINWMTAMQNPETQQAFLAYMKPEHFIQWLSSVHNLAAQHHSLQNN